MANSARVVQNLDKKLVIIFFLKFLIEVKIVFFCPSKRKTNSLNDN